MSALGGCVGGRVDGGVVRVGHTQVNVDEGKPAPGDGFVDRSTRLAIVGGPANKTIGVRTTVQDAAMNKSVK